MKWQPHLSEKSDSMRFEDEEELLTLLSEIELKSQARITFIRSENLPKAESLIADEQQNCEKEIYKVTQDYVKRRMDEESTKADVEQSLDWVDKQLKVIQREKNAQALKRLDREEEELLELIQQLKAESLATESSLEQRISKSKKKK